MNNSIDIVAKAREAVNHIPFNNSYYEAIDRIKTDLDLIMNTINDLEKNSNLLDDSKSFISEMMQFLSRGEKINAIKYIRTITGWSLMDAKNFVDDFIANAGRPLNWPK